MTGDSDNSGDHRAPSLEVAAPADRDVRRALEDFIRLIHLADLQHRRLWAMRLALAYAVWIGVAGAGLLVVVGQSGEQAALGLIAVRAVTWLSWVTGGFALWSATTTCGSQPAAVTELARLRGYPEEAVRWCSTGALALRVTYLTAIPALLLAGLGLGWSPSVHALLWTLVLCGALVGYAMVLGACVALVARLACVTSPRRARSVALSLVAVPYLAHAAWPQVPSIPTMFAWLTERLVAVGAMTV